LRYALDGVLRHADYAAYHGSRQMPFSTDFTFKDWLAVKNCIMENDGTHHCHPSGSPSLLHVLVVENCSHLVDIELSGSSSSLSKELWAHLDATNLQYKEDVGFKVTGSMNRPTNTIPARCIGGALHMAVRYISVEIARALIRSGADPNDHCQVVGSPLFVATRFRNRGNEIVRILLE
jgi:hypothetical protein